MRAAEQILTALHRALCDDAPAGLRVERNTSVPAREPDLGLLILRDGTPGQPEVTLSPLRYHFEHRAEVEVLIEGPESDRDAAFDLLLQWIGRAVDRDRTLGGLCDWVEAEAPAPVLLPTEGAETLKAASVAVILHYATDDPLS